MDESFIGELEITTGIGCSINCLKYCPQDIIIKNYQGVRKLDLESFNCLLNTVPKEINIIFSGVSEPFLNQQCPDMIVSAHRKGHRIFVFSTLVGLSMENAKKIKDIPFEKFTLHLPDCYGIANIPATDEYNTVRDFIERSVENIDFMNMGGKFVTNHREEYIRGGSVIKNTFTPRCDRLTKPHYLAMPNGEVFFCCQTMGQGKSIGSLFNETFVDLVKKQPALKKELQEDPNSICYRCSFASSLVKYNLMKLKNIVARKL